MIRRLSLLLALLAVSGSAWAAHPSELAGLGYSTSVSLNGECSLWRASGFGVSVDFGSSCAPGFQERVDAFVAGHPERKLGYEHPAAVSARGSLSSKGYSVSTNYSGPSFTVTGGCEVNQTVDAGGLVGLDSSLPTAAPCPPPAPPPPPQTTTTEPPPADTEPPPPTQTGPTAEELAARIAELEAKLAALAGRVDALQAANIAAWNAWVAATEQGLPAYEVALAARSAGLNALYDL